MYESLIH